ncbi:MAG TPA: SDR family oxidoreductase [Acidimicrobiales bacterium]|jgi:nucleoside-diphosphate-sugar epimerase
MRVFVTGASGHIGSALVSDLIEGGHEVVGLARSDESALALKELGAEVQRGDLDDLEGLAAAAAAADGVAHLAYKHDVAFTGEPSDFIRAATFDLEAVQAIGAALEGSDKPFVITSGTLLLAMAALGRMGTEADALESGPRIDSENVTIARADRGVRSSVIRLSPLVHSTLDHHGFAHQLIARARTTGVSAYVGEGSNRWPAVHTLDAAHLYRLALESAPAGSRLHGVGDEGVPVRQIAEVIGRQLDLPVVSIDPGDATAQFGSLATFVQLDNPTSNALTRELLQWEPTRPGLIEDLEAGHYFEGAVA